MRSRLILLLCLVVCWLGAIVARLYDLQVVRHSEFAARARAQQEQAIQIRPPRGTIFDARGRKLAVSRSVESAYGVPREIDDPAGLARELARRLDLDRRSLTERLSSDKAFVWVKRKLSEAEAASLRELGHPQIGFVEEARRDYPFGTLAAQVLGFVGTDDYGLHGIEAEYDAAVAADPVRRTVLRDAHRRVVLYPPEPLDEPKPGKDLWLTLDATVQYIVEEELAAAVERYQARGGTVVVLDPWSGAVLAMASWPTFDPASFAEADPATWRNRAIADAYEPGSTFKMVTAAAALEANLFDPADVIDCGRGGIALDGVYIHDHKPFDQLTFRDVIARSSNVGAIRIGLKVGGRGLYEQARGFGFGALTGIDLPGENAGLLWPFEQWRPITAAYFSFGQGLAVSALQLTQAFSAVANGGVLYRPYVVASIGGPPPVERRRQELGRPIGPATTRSLVRLLEAVVEDGGGKLAKIDGYRVAGKTGTAQKAERGRGYIPGRYVSSFVGFAPSRDPAVVAVVALDEPRGAIYYGGLIAAPTFSRIIGRVLPYLGVPPDREPDRAWPGEADDAAEATPQEALLADAAPAIEPVPEGSLPDLQGLTARQAVAETVGLGFEPRLAGSGFVVRQAPPPGTPLEQVRQVDLWLETKWSGEAGGR